jgi:putative Mg2+ transporter-C (MgtC) family protein
MFNDSEVILLGIGWDDFNGLAAIAIAGALGALIGLEREFAQKPAGIRTHIFVCAGSALMMVVGQEIVDQFDRTGRQDLYESDPIRVLQAIVVGISFLGTGTIIHDRRDGVEGLTTAATIFVTSGIGVAVAVDRIPLAAALALASLAVLLAVGWLERYIETRWARPARGETRSSRGSNAKEPSENDQGRDSAR